MTNKFLLNLREEKGVAQQSVAKKLGLTRQTYAQIEKGERDLTLKEAQILSKLYAISLDEIIQGKRNEIEVKVPKLEKSIPKKPSIQIQVPKESVKKFKEALLYILSKIGARPNVGQTVLYKLFYFIDFDYFEKYGKKLIGATYIKNQYGPTPVEFKKITDNMKKAGELEAIKSKYFEYGQKKYLPLRDADLSVFSGPELQMIEETLEKLGRKNAQELSNYSHGDVPWIATENRQIIDYRLVYEREAPYTEHDHWEEFVQAGAIDILKDLGPISDEEYDYYQSFKK
jgi:transcriptional regulator with XRE-family HTH domain